MYIYRRLGGLGTLCRPNQEIVSFRRACVRACVRSMMECRKAGYENSKKKFREGSPYTSIINGKKPFFLVRRSSASENDTNRFSVANCHHKSDFPAHPSFLLKITFFSTRAKPCECALLHS